MGTGSNPPGSEGPVLNIVGERVALGPLRAELLPLYERWINDFRIIRMLDLPPAPATVEKERDWYEGLSKGENDMMFTIYERETLRPIGNTALHGLDHRNRSASFGIIIGEPEFRGRGLGTETTRLMLDYAFTALGLHNVMLTVFEFNPAGTRLRLCKREPHRRSFRCRRWTRGTPPGASSCIRGGAPLGIAPKGLRAPPWRTR